MPSLLCYKVSNAVYSAFIGISDLITTAFLLYLIIFIHTADVLKNQYWSKNSYKNYCYFADIIYFYDNVLIGGLALVSVVLILCSSVQKCFRYLRFTVELFSFLLVVMYPVIYGLVLFEKYGNQIDQQFRLEELHKCTAVLGIIFFLSLFRFIIITLHATVQYDSNYNADNELNLDLDN